MLTQIINGQILTPQGWLNDGSVLISDGKILEVTNSDLAVIGATVIDAKGMYIIPGFVAMNVYGGGGHDFCECTDEAFHKVIETHRLHGATSIFPTLTSTCSKEEILNVIDLCEQLMKEKDTPIEGLHLKGPYLNPKMASPLYNTKPFDKDEYTDILDHSSCIKRWDVSPELSGSHEFARYARSKGVFPAISHTEAEYPEVRAAFEAGLTHVSQFYNAMPGFHKRREFKYEGTVESVYLLDDMTVEIVADGKHLPSTILRLVYKLKGVERTCLVTDALKYAASDLLPEPDSKIIIDDGVCKLADHSSLVGSIATMDVLVRTMVQKAGVPLADAVRMASETPAHLLGIDDCKGTLQRGKNADIIVMDRNLQIRSVFAKGNIVEGTNKLF